MTVDQIDDFLTDNGDYTEAALTELRELLFNWKRKHGADAIVLLTSFFEEALGPGGTAKYRPATIQYGNPDLCAAILNRVIDNGVDDDRAFAVFPDDDAEEA